MESLKQPVASDSAYFILSHFIHVKHIVASYDDEKLCVAFLINEELNNYKIYDINKCNILTEEEYKQKVKDIKTELNKELECLN